MTPTTHPASTAATRRCHAVILLEVVIALTLFVLTAGVVVGAINQSLRAARQLRSDAIANDLCVTLISEIQAEIRPFENAGPVPFDPPFQEWQLEVETPSVDAAADGRSMVAIEVTVTHLLTGQRRRLVQWIRRPDHR